MKIEDLIKILSHFEETIRGPGFVLDIIYTEYSNDCGTIIRNWQKNLKKTMQRTIVDENKNGHGFHCRSKIIWLFLIKNSKLLLDDAIAIGLAE